MGKQITHLSCPSPGDVFWHEGLEKFTVYLKTAYTKPFSNVFLVFGDWNTRSPKLRRRMIPDYWWSPTLTKVTPVPKEEVPKGLVQLLKSVEHSFAKEITIEG